MRRLLLLSALPLLALAQDADVAQAWKASGQYFAWQSTQPENQG